MKKLIIAVAALLVTVASYGQGTLSFNNIWNGVGPGKVFLPDGTTGVGAGFTAQLLAGPAGTAVDSLVALSPTTTFRTGNAAGYVTAVQVSVPGVAAGAQATIVMRAFNGADYASSQIKGQSAPITLGLGGTPAGGAPIPDPVLNGLASFTLTQVPEPSTIALGIIGAAALLYRRRK
jgi:hypothetical protein